MGSTVVTSTSSSSAASAPATPGQVCDSESHTSRTRPHSCTQKRRANKNIGEISFQSKNTLQWPSKHKTQLLPVCSGSLLSSSSMSNSDSLSSYSTFSSSSLKSGAKALQFSWRQIIPISWKLAERMVMKTGSWGKTPVLYMTGAKIPLSKNINRHNF